MDELQINVFFFYFPFCSGIKRGQPTKSPQSPHVVTGPRSLTKCTVGIGKQIPKGNENRLMKTTDRLSARHLVAESIKLGHGSIPGRNPHPSSRRRVPRVLLRFLIFLICLCPFQIRFSLLLLFSLKSTADGTT